MSPLRLSAPPATLVPVPSMMAEAPQQMMDADVEVVAEASAENVAVMRQAAMAAAEAADLPPERVEDVALAVGEACANVVMHAYDGARGTFALLVLCTEGGLEFVVRDWGSGLGPRPDSPGLGLGLPLIGALADRVELEASDDGATDVRMVFADGVVRRRGDVPPELWA